VTFDSITTNGTMTRTVTIRGWPLIAMIAVALLAITTLALATLTGCSGMKKFSDTKPVLVGTNAAGQAVYSNPDNWDVAGGVVDHLKRLDDKVTATPGPWSSYAGIVGGLLASLSLVLHGVSRTKRKASLEIGVTTGNPTKINAT